MKYLTALLSFPFLIFIPSLVLAGDIEWSLENMTYSQSINIVEANRSINPSNLIAQQSGHVVGNHLRPSFRYTNNKIDVWMKPRLQFDGELELPVESSGYVTLKHR